MKTDNVNQFKDILNDIGNTYEKKNSDYGNAIQSAIDKFGFIYTACMLYNKYSRFENLISKNDFEGKVGESLVDTLLDMAVYCIESARVMQNQVQEAKELQDLDYYVDTEAWNDEDGDF